LSLVQAQQPISYEQAFKGAPTNMMQPLPTVSKWLDGKYFLETRMENNVRKTVKVNAISGVTEAYTIPAEEKPAVAVPAIAVTGARNQTTSPDGKYFAYTKKDNNLYPGNCYQKRNTAD
jgi:dipeptidyl-peptidase-4